MKVEASLPTADLRRIGPLARRREALGYDGLTVAEIKNDSLLAVAAAALATEQIDIATSAAIAFPRSPMITAMMAWDIQRASAGRFTLGLATQVKGHNERRFSTPWVGPAQPRMREYIGALRAIWHTWQTGESLDYRGQYYSHTLMTPEFNPGPLESGPPKLTITAVGPYMARLAGELCDGVRLHGFCTARYIEQVIKPELAIGAARAGRDPSDLAISGGGFIATGPTDAEVERQREAARTRVAFYGSTRTYHGVFQVHGWEDIGPRLHELSLRGEWEAMPKVVPDEVLDAFVVAGRYDQIVPRLLDRFGGVCTKIGLTLPDETPEEVEAARALIAALRAEETPVAAG